MIPKKKRKKIFNHQLILIFILTK